MKMNRIISIAIGILLCTGLHAQIPAAPVIKYSDFQINRQPQVPEYIVFAGDTVRFDTAERRERMDREILTFCYMHSTSLLMIKRANRYFPQIEPLLKAGGIPDDLKYLMVIESNLDPKALSSAGAAGLWQFMKASGKEYGLHIDSEVDERYHEKKATQAACKYLRDSYAKYKDWMTVAASYNAGQAGISKRLESQKQKSAMDLWLVEETARYMYRVMACKMYFENPSAFGFAFTPDMLYPYVPIKEEVRVDGGIPSLVDFAIEHGVTYADLKRANLWLRDDKLTNKEGRTYYIAIPDVKAEKNDPSKTKVHSLAWLYRPI